MSEINGMNYEIDISNRQSVLALDLQELRAALIHALQLEKIASAVLSISIVDNATIHQLNREHLQHDYPTDVISFSLELLLPETGKAGSLRAEGAVIEGEIVASAEMALEMASEGQWTPASELKLYLIHGMLHLCGYDDLTANEQSIMRTREREIMNQLGLRAIYAEDANSISRRMQG